MTTELKQQIYLFDWIRTHESQYELLRFIFHVPNGGFRHISTAVKLKRSGVRPGIPDVLILVPMQGYHGCAIEMKAGKNKTTPEQKRWLEDLKNFGYSTHVCYSWIEAARVICEYLDLPKELIKEVL